jgi:hypothetical protein
MTRVAYALLLACLALGLVGVARAATDNIDPDNKWAWGTNVGWINFDPTSKMSSGLSRVTRSLVDAISVLAPY